MQKPIYRIFYLSIIYLALSENIFAVDTSIGVLNIIDKNEDELSTINYKGEPYISVKDISRILSDREPYENAARQKIVLYLSDNRVKISNLSRFIIVNDKIFQLTKHSFVKEKNIYVLDFCSKEDCNNIIKSAELSATFHKGWRTKRHGKYPTTDIPFLYLYQTKTNNWKQWLTNKVKEKIIPIDFSQSRDAILSNINARKQAENVLLNDGVIVLFPSGQIATKENFKKKTKAHDGNWKQFTSKLVIKTKSPVLPIYFEGQNSQLFHIANKMGLTFRYSLMMYELKRKIGDTINLHVGEIIPFSQLNEIGDLIKITKYLRQKTYALDPNFK